jgi:hypothetical protein
VKENSNHSFTRQLLHNNIFPAIYRLQIMLGIRPRGVCLITGCPRSGTRAILKWLGMHEQITAFEESRLLLSVHRFTDEVEKFHDLYANRIVLIDMIRKFFYTYRARDKILWRKQLVEKEPLEPIAFPDKRYREFLENLRTIFPDIKLLFMLRDPIETIWSMRQRPWGFSLKSKKLHEFSLEECIDTWNTNADIICDYVSDSNVYVCMFERLISDPKEESRRIFKFLSIRDGRQFQPKPTKTPGFSNDEREFILQKTNPQRELLLSMWER